MSKIGHDYGDQDVETKIRNLEIQQQVLREIYERSAEQILHFSETVSGLKEDLIRVLEHYKTTHVSVSGINATIEKINDKCAQRHIDFNKHYTDYSSRIEDLKKLEKELEQAREAIQENMNNITALRNKLKTLILIFVTVWTLLSGTIAVFSNLATASGGYFGFHFVPPGGTDPNQSQPPK